MKAKGIVTESEGALVVDVQEESDTKEVPPCILVKSDGATLYATTDLATLVQRMKDFQPDEVLYLTDKRQALHFEQVFRAARKGGLVPEHVVLKHLWGFGTMNGKDGKPFKTREGGVMRLEASHRRDHRLCPSEDHGEPGGQRGGSGEHRTPHCHGRLKYGDLSNQPTKDYVFDLERFAAFEGNTGPYFSIPLSASSPFSISTARPCAGGYAAGPKPRRPRI